MKSIAFTVRLRGQTASVMEDLVRRGYSGSKTELVRTALLFYAMQLGFLAPKALHRNVLKRIAASGKKYSDKEIREQIQQLG